MAGNVLVQVSPYPQVQRWEHRGCTGEADAAPYVSIAFGGWQWCYYGMFAYLLTNRSGFLILVHSNFLGALLGTYYTFTFYRNCRNEDSLNSLNKYLSAVTALALLQGCAILVLPMERALFLTGLISSFCSFLGALSMLVTVPLVLRSKSSRSIPGPVVVANLLSGIVWCLCGWMLADPLVTGPNIVAVVACLICMYLKFQFPSDDKMPEPDEIACILAAMQEPELKVDCPASELVPFAKLGHKAALHSTFGPPKVEDPSSSLCAEEANYGGTGGTF